MSLHEVQSPIPGVFYRSPEPTIPAYVEVGQMVAEADTIGLVEVMKSFHPITAGVAGKVVEIGAENESVVNAGEVLMSIEVSS
ncbi:biotin carboxyl carrier protein [Prauserella sediminis]|uniref:Biotin carboxyl carrier protein of acetyl-CoA carboxylase n=1 Tax=Prauserella sediminis TaxID=577680 RepID=A0A839XTX9_9PSEU|nr:acetyl-CoA carboxylase [Prauserella sediminis]MBB3664488.1 biotin carboxyl carrier protein [Prauserella sediminis]